ncbi:hypothetical protein CBR_g17141 [Chara braunii]|uniref:Uncharacterized protein n=1 Tax=Chara braunii TaxID=69332 RepID=A0A388KUY3_CHABU|nr:hypothetical protein CBR_g17141 [Chara braunii]|eukprot:GBG73802.1 hypothetical protein CBR_g17141 [Chara braunii]
MALAAGIRRPITIRQATTLNYAMYAWMGSSMLQYGWKIAGRGCECGRRRKSSLLAIAFSICESSSSDSRAIAANKKKPERRTRSVYF